MPVRTHAWLWGSLCWALMSDPEESPGKSSLRQGATANHILQYSTLSNGLSIIMYYNQNVYLNKEKTHLTLICEMYFDY